MFICAADYNQTLTPASIQTESPNEKWFKQETSGYTTRVRQEASEKQDPISDRHTSDGIPRNTTHPAN